MLNKKGAVLPITVAAMFVIMIAGLACLKLFSAQAMLSGYDLLRLRTYYIAEGYVDSYRDAFDRNGTTATDYSDIAEDTTDTLVANETSSGSGSPNIKTTVTLYKYLPTSADFAWPAGLNYATASAILIAKYGEGFCTIKNISLIEASSSATLESNIASGTITTKVKYYYLCCDYKYYINDEAGNPVEYHRPARFFLYRTKDVSVA